MEWLVKLGEKTYRAVFPSCLVAQQKFFADVGGKRFFLRWDPVHQAIFVSESTGDFPTMERCFRVRNHSFEKLPFNGQKRVRFQIAGPGLAVVETDIGPLSRARLAKRFTPKALPGKQHSPLTGTILKLFLTPGASIQAGDEVAVIEAMKMENKILSELTGVVRDIYVKDKGKITMGDALFSTAPEIET
ncbi:MAG: acetyl-CoA carboxylase biotin carboxyl carrier protein subunit [Deltaproteobacteria bacterium]|nr:acetyl-CoA carboxylase biotin carboxyl carrier protein subunit [Deltaproteobacteria bacterium]